MTNFRGTGISGPAGITKGWDGNLWFTNQGNDSIGLITPAVVANYTATGISTPSGIAPASHYSEPRIPYWTVRLTNYRGNNSIGRITAGRGDHPLPQGDIDGPSGILQGWNGPCGSRTSGTARSGGSPTRGWSPTSPARASATRRGSWWTGTGDMWFTNFGNSSIGRITQDGVVTNYVGTGIGCS